MAYPVQKTSEGVVYALLASVNAFRREQAVAQSKVHADITCKPTPIDFHNPVATPNLVTAATPTDLATLVVSCQDIYRVYAAHIADGLAHLTADTTNTIGTSLPAPADQAAVNTFLNSVKTAFNAHRSQSGVHCTNDASNAVSATNASDQASAITLASAIKVAINAHIQSGFTSPAVTIVA